MAGTLFFLFSGKCVHQKFGGATKHEMNSLKEAFKGVCEYRDTLEKQSTKMLKDMYIMAKEHKSIENRRSIVTRQLDELNRLMADVKGDRHATPMKSNR